MGGGRGGVASPSSSSSSSPSSSSSSSSSSIDSISNNNPSFSSSSSSVSQPPNTNRSCLSTDLRLGPSVSDTRGSPRDQRFDWAPPIKEEKQSQPNNLFVKVYMEGISIGRKLDLFAHCGYDGLVTTLSHMFKTTIACPDSIVGHGGADHILTYEDEDGDWMMVGDVPWEMFLNTVKRLRITRDRC